MRITRRQLIGQRLLELRDLGFEIGDLGGEAGIVGGEFARSFQIVLRSRELVVRRHDRRELGEPLTDAPGSGRVVVQRRIGHLRFETGVLRQDVVDGRGLGCACHGSLRSEFRFLRCALEGISTPDPGNAQTECRHKKADARSAHGRSGVGGTARTRWPDLAVCALAVASLEASDASTGVENLLLARVERVALRANLDVDASGLFGAVGLERVTATADDGGRYVGWVDSCLHGVPFNGRRVDFANRHREPEPDSAVQYARVVVASNPRLALPAGVAYEFVNALPLVCSTRDTNRPTAKPAVVGPSSLTEDQSSIAPGAVLETCIRNSRLFLLFFSRSISRSMA